MLLARLLEIERNLAKTTSTRVVDLWLLDDRLRLRPFSSGAKTERFPTLVHGINPPRGDKLVIRGLP